MLILLHFNTLMIYSLMIYYDLQVDTAPTLTIRTRAGARVTWSLKAGLSRRTVKPLLPSICI